MAGATTMAEEVGYHLMVYMLEDFSPPLTEPGHLVMDSALWSQLPEDLVDKILLVLPRRSQVRFRAVSRAWRLRLTSAEFQARSAALAFYSARFLCGIVYRDIDDCPLLGSTRYPIEVDNEDIPLEDENKDILVRYKVHKLSLAFLPSDFQNLAEMLRVIRLSPWRLFSHLFIHVQNGLIVLARRTSDSAQCKLCVVNLVNETWKELLSPLCPDDTLVLGVGSVVDEAGHHHFKLLIGTSDAFFRSVYYSKTDAWTDHGHNKSMAGFTNYEEANSMALRIDASDISRSLRPDHAPWFRYKALDVGGILKVQIRRPSMEGTEEGELIVFSEEHWACVSCEERFGSIIVAGLHLLDIGNFPPDDHVYLYLAYNVTLGSWKVLHSSIYMRTRSPSVRHRFFKPEPSLRL